MHDRSEMLTSPTLGEFGLIAACLLAGLACTSHEPAETSSRITTAPVPLETAERSAVRERASGSPVVSSLNAFVPLHRTISRGYTVQLVPDLDQDGRPEVLCSSPCENFVAIVSTKSYEPIWTHHEAEPIGHAIHVLSTGGDTPKPLVAVSTVHGVVVLSPVDDRELLRWIDQGEPYSPSVLLLAVDDRLQLFLGAPVRLDEGVELRSKVTSLAVDGSGEPRELVDELEFGGFGISLGAVRDSARPHSPILLVGAVPNTAPGAPNAVPGRVRAFDSITHRLLYEIVGREPDDRFGWRLRTLPDIDGDGCEDVLVVAAGAMAEDRTDWSEVGQASYLGFISGRDGRLLDQLPIVTDAPHTGHDACPVGDLDGDGSIDIAVTSTGALWARGEVSAYSLKKRSILWTRPGWRRSEWTYVPFGSSVCGGADFDGDGVPDVVVGAGCASWFDGDGEGGGPGSIFFYSGATGDLFRVLE